MEKESLGFRIYKIWQILKRFAGTFRRAQTLKLGGVMSCCRRHLCLSLESSIFWKITIIVNDRLFLHMTTLRDDEYFMSSILCNPGSKKNHSFLKVVSYF